MQDIEGMSLPGGPGPSPITLKKSVFPSWSSRFWAGSGRETVSCCAIQPLPAAGLALRMNRVALMA